MELQVDVTIVRHDAPRLFDSFRLTAKPKTAPIYTDGVELVAIAKVLHLSVVPVRVRVSKFEPYRTVVRRSSVGNATRSLEHPLEFALMFIDFLASTRVVCVDILPSTPSNTVQRDNQKDTFVLGSLHSLAEPGWGQQVVILRNAYHLTLFRSKPSDGRVSTRAKFHDASRYCVGTASCGGRHPGSF
jgi:hypothetical protein